MGEISESCASYFHVVLLINAVTLYFFAIYHTRGSNSFLGVVQAAMYLAPVSYVVAVIAAFMDMMYHVAEGSRNYFITTVVSLLLQLNA